MVRVDDPSTAETAELPRPSTEVSPSAPSAQRGGRFGSLVVGTLVAVCVAAFLAATLGVWAERNLLDTDRYVQRVAPLSEDPDVQAALATRLTTEIMTLVDPEAIFTEALPARGALLAAPLTDAIEGFVHDKVLQFVQSDAFTNLWREANERAHRRAVQVLEGEGPVLQAGSDQVTIDLVPIINSALAEIGEASPELFGREIDLPTLTVDDVPRLARVRLQEALGRPIDEDFGTITVYDNGKLQAAQEGLDLFEKFRVASIVLTIVSFGTALWISRRRRRTLLQLLVGMAIGLVLIRRITLWAESYVAGLAPVPENRPAVEAVMGVFLDPLLYATGWIVFGLAAAALVAVVTGPYPWAVRLRGQVGRTAKAVSGGHAATGDVPWLQTHRDAVQIGAGAALLLLLWQTDLGPLAAVLAVVAFGIFVVVVNRLAGPEPDAT